MAGLLAYAAAGLAEGAGKGMVEDAKAKREAAREKLRMDFQTSERVAGQDYRTGERKATQDFTGTQNQANRDATSKENRLNRESTEALQAARLDATRRRELETDQQYKSFETRDNGVLVGIRSDGTAVEITDAQGEPVKPRVSTKNTNPVTDQKTADEIARQRAEDVVGPAPDQKGLTYDPADLVAYNEKFLPELNRQREAMGLPPLTSAPKATTQQPLPKAAETAVADRVDGKEYDHNGKTYIWRAKDGKWEPK